MLAVREGEWKLMWKFLDNLNPPTRAEELHQCEAGICETTSDITQ
jgi:hypothetical protein